MNQDTTERVLKAAHRTYDQKAAEFGDGYAQEFAAIQLRALAEWLNWSIGTQDTYEIFQSVADAIAGAHITGKWPASDT
jgi:hypothetical protein